MYFTILGKRWKYTRPKKCVDEGKTTNNYGFCDAPDLKNKTIQVKKSLKGQTELEIILHECMHAAAYKLLSEEWVSDASHDLAKILWRLGYRKSESED